MFEQSFVLDQKARTVKLSLGLCFYSLAKPLCSNFLIFSLGEEHHNTLGEQYTLISCLILDR